MLSKIKLANFRQHRSLELCFGEGLTAIRGANEAGKSTLGEAIVYALFGVKACRSPLSDIVTWGEVESTLKVELEVIVDGVTYCVKRGSSGAEVVYGGDGRATGQSEVSNFMARLLKVDASSAAKLMFSNQKKIASALESGTQATTELIERLAEFDQIDKLIDLMQEKLTLGSGASAQGQLDAATARVERSKGAVEPHLPSLQGEIESRTTAVENLQAVLERQQALLDALRDAANKASASREERDSLKRRLDKLERRYTETMSEVCALKAKVVIEPVRPDDRILALMAERDDVAKAVARSDAWKAVRTLVGDTGIAHFKGDSSAWQEALDKAQTGLDAARASLRASDVKFAALQAKLNSGNCTFCGEDFSDLPEVQAKNAQIQELMDGFSAETSAAQTAADTLQAEIKSLGEIRDGGKSSLAAIQKYAEYLDIDDKSFPPFFAWKGEEPDEDEVLKPDYDANIQTIKRQVREHRDWIAALDKVNATLESFAPEREAIAERQKELGPDNDDGTDHQANLTKAVEHVNEARSELKTSERRLQDAKDELKDAQRSWESAQRESAEATAAVETAREALVTLDFNNALLKKVRSARPVIADKLWNLVLASVSSYFSEMRGEKSRVTKGPDGFMIDEHPVPSFSGSTIDILGLAIRVALVRTFLPSCPFLLLDEPAAACSDARTDNMLGFLQGAGYKQVLICSHDEISESVANHVIYLGGDSA